MLDMEKFNYSYHNVGDYNMLLVIEKYLYKDNEIEEKRLDYLKNLLGSVFAFNYCIIIDEQYGVTDLRIYDIYKDLKDLLFLEMGIKYDIERDMYVLESEEK